MTEVRCSDFDGYLVPDACHEDEDEYGFTLALIFELESLYLLSKLGVGRATS